MTTDTRYLLIELLTYALHPQTCLDYEQHKLMAMHKYRDSPAFQHQVKYAMHLFMDRFNIQPKSETELQIQLKRTTPPRTHTANAVSSRAT